MSLGGNVNDEVDLVLLQDEREEVEGTEISLDEVEPRILSNGLVDVLGTRIIIDPIKDDELLRRWIGREDLVCDFRSDEPITAS